MRGLLDRSAAGAGARPPLPDLPPDVQAVVRHGTSHEYLTLLNHGTMTVTVPLPSPAPDLLNAGTVTDAVTLPPRGVAGLRR